MASSLKGALTLTVPATRRAILLSLLLWLPAAWLGEARWCDGWRCWALWPSPARRTTAGRRSGTTRRTGPGSPCPGSRSGGPRRASRASGSSSATTRRSRTWSTGATASGARSAPPPRARAPRREPQVQDPRARQDRPPGVWAAHGVPDPGRGLDVRGVPAGPAHPLGEEQKKAPQGRREERHALLGGGHELDGDRARAPRRAPRDGRGGFEAPRAPGPRGRSSARPSWATRRRRSPACRRTASSSSASRSPSARRRARSPPAAASSSAVP